MSKVNNMAAKSDWDIYQVSAIVYLSIHSVNAYYCDNDRCTEEEYCCGDNTCCPSYKVWDLWYFCAEVLKHFNINLASAISKKGPVDISFPYWCGVMFFMFLLTMCACLWRYRFLSDGAVFVSGYSYTAMQEVDVMGPYQELSPSSKYIRTNNKLFTSPLDTPHLYNHISAGSVKLAAPSSTYAQVVGMRESH